MPKPPVKKIPLDFDRSVFINCPFDNKYLPLFRAIIFTIHDMGFRARCALEASNAGNVRIDRFRTLLPSANTAFTTCHVPSWTKTHRLPRFNMPLELGLDLGSKKFGKEHEQEKVVLVMDIERFRYQRFISDISG